MNYVWNEILHFLNFIFYYSLEYRRQKEWKIEEIDLSPMSTLDNDLEFFQYEILKQNFGHFFVEEKFEKIKIG